jgi:NAD(P)-dependent dehydrogenase (short-subunit alcohol dehydrogenase family)
VPHEEVEGRPDPRTALVTGAASGIGQAVARSFLDAIGASGATEGQDIECADAALAATGQAPTG